jgi:hypothetical protein
VKDVQWNTTIPDSVFKKTGEEVAVGNRSKYQTFAGIQSMR